MILKTRKSERSEAPKTISGVAIGKKIKRFEPDLVISYGSPEAARISFGLGIKHIMFCDSPHANAVMKLTLPLIQKLLIPYVISKKEFSKYGIKEKDIVQYKAIDAVVTMKRKINENYNLKSVALGLLFSFLLLVISVRNGYKACQYERCP